MLKNYTKVKVDEYGTKHYLNDEGKRHRLDGPAIESSHGTKFWCINGNCHRNIDPVKEYSDGGKYWWFKGKTHRVGSSSSSSLNWWFIHDKEYSKQDYINIVWDI